MIVVQAGAGRRALASTRRSPGAALRHIEGGERAELEIAQFVDLLGDAEPQRVRSGQDARDARYARTPGTAGTDGTPGPAGARCEQSTSSCGGRPRPA